MPFGWMQFSTASSELVEQYRGRPTDLENQLRQDLERAGATLQGRLMFEADRRYAHAHVKDLDDPVKRKGILDRYRGSYWKLLLPEELEEADRFRRELGGEGSTESAG